MCLAHGRTQNNMREWLSWWSTTLPRSGSRVRVPSRALIKLYIADVFQIRSTKTCASGSVGGARPCQGRGRGFESRLALLLIVAEALILQGFRSFYVVVVKLFCNICGQIQKLLHIKYT